MYEIVNLNLFCLIMIIINSLYRKEMSYAYPLYSCFNPFSQALYPFFVQAELPTTIPPIYVPNDRSLNFESHDGGQFKPIIVTITNTCESLQQLENKSRIKRETHGKREIYKNKDESFGWRNQNKDRNLISSILKGYAHHVLQGQGMLKLIERLSKRRTMENGVSKFLSFVGHKFPTRKSYVGLRYMQDALTAHPFDDDITYLLRLTLHHYLVEVYPLQVVETTKTKKKIKISLLKKARSIRALLFAS